MPGLFVTGINELGAENGFVEGRALGTGDEVGDNFGFLDLFGFFVFSALGELPPLLFFFDPEDPS